MALFYKNVKETTHLVKLVEIMSAASEFQDNLPLRSGEDAKIDSLWSRMEHDADLRAVDLYKSTEFTKPWQFKAYALIWAHFLRTPLKDALLQQRFPIFFV